jgi:hypothetical protein
VHPVTNKLSKNETEVAMKTPKRLRVLLERMLDDRMKANPSGNRRIVRRELRHAIDSLFIPPDQPERYPRMMGADEQRIISAHAFQYLLSLLDSGQLDTQTFEKIMNLCVHLAGISPHSWINLPRMVQIVNLIFFSGVNETTWKQLIDIVVGEEESHPTLH